MKYTEFRDAIKSALERNPEGKTWKELRASLSLPYSRPCPVWTKQLEKEISLKRDRRQGRELVWRI